MQRLESAPASRGNQVSTPVAEAASRRRPHAAGAFLVLVMAACLLAPWVSPHGPEALDLASKLSAPNLSHPLGTDTLGRDLLARTLYGGRVSLLVAAVTMCIALLAGFAVGAVAGVARGRLDALLVGLTDLTLSLPGFFLALVACYRFGGSPVVLSLTLGGLFWMEVARLVRGRILMLSRQEFVVAAVATGASRSRVLWRHLLPNLRGTLRAAAVLLLARAIHAEAALSFLGFGVRPPRASWGSLLADARHHVGLAPWLVLGPGLCLFLTLWAIHGLRQDARDAP